MNEVSEKELARMYLQARLLRCPLGDNPEDCPLHEVRKKPMHERYEWLNRKDDEEVVEMFRLHTKCINRKLQED